MLLCPRCDFGSQQAATAVFAGVDKTKRRARQVAVALILLLPVAATTAFAEQVAIGADTTHIDLSAQAAWLEDPGAKLSLADIQLPGTAARFAPIGPRGLSVGYSSSAWWARAMLRNDAPFAGEWLLSLPTARLDRATLHLHTTEGVAVHHDGVLVPLRDRQMGRSTASFRLTLPARSTTTLWLRVQSDHTPLVVPLHLWRAGYLAAGQSLDFVLLGLLLGVIAYLLLAVAATARTKVSSQLGALLLYGTGLVTWLCAAFELDVVWLLADAPSIAHAMPHAARVATCLGAAWFSHSFKQLRLPALRMGKRVQVPSVAVLATSALAVAQPQFSAFADGVAFAAAVVLSLACLPAIARDRWTGSLLVAAWCALAAIQGIAVLRGWGWWPAMGDPHALPALLAVAATLPLAVVFGRDQVQAMRELAQHAAERLAAEQALVQERHDRLRTVLAAAPDALLVLGPDGDITFANPVACALFGHDANVLEGKPVEFLIPLTARERDQRVREDYARRGGANPMFNRRDVAGLRADGQSFAAQVDIAPHLTDAGQAWLVSVHDVSAQRAAEQAVVAERALLQQVIDALQLAVAAVDRAGYYLFVNKQWELVEGRNAAEVVGRQLVDVHGSEEGARLWEAYWWPVVEQGAKLGAEFERTIDGRAMVLASTFSPIRNPLGETVGACAWTADITADRKQLRDLARARDEAEVANRAKSRFLASVTSELHTPLHAVIGLAGVLGRNLHDQQHQRQAEAIAANARALLGLVDNLLDLARIDSGALELRPAPTDLRQLLRDVERMFTQRAGERGVRLVVHIDTAIPPAVVVDGARVRQVAVNLVGHALRSTETGEVRVSLTSAPETRAGCVRLALVVNDTGAGIAPEDLLHVFDEWERAESSRRSGGTGLGLATTRRLVERMGGTIEARSTQRVGSQFAVTWPEVQIALGRDLAEIGDADRALPVFDPLQTVVVATDPSLVALLAGWLQQLGLRVAQATSAREAEAMARQARPAAVLADAQLLAAESGALAIALFGLAGKDPLVVIGFGGDSDTVATLSLGGLCTATVPSTVDRTALAQVLARYLPTRSAAEKPGRLPGRFSPTTLAVAVGGATTSELARKVDSLRDEWREGLAARDLDRVIALGQRLAHWGDQYHHPTLAHWAGQAIACAESFDLEGLDSCAAEIEALTAGLVPPIEV